MRFGVVCLLLTIHYHAAKPIASGLFDIYGTFWGLLSISYFLSNFSSASTAAWFSLL